MTKIGIIKIHIFSPASFGGVEVAAPPVEELATPTLSGWLEVLLLKYSKELPLPEILVVAPVCSPFVVLWVRLPPDCRFAPFCCP